jgi:hypothetical protein
MPMSGRSDQRGEPVWWGSNCTDGDPCRRPVGEGVLRVFWQLKVEMGAMMILLREQHGAYTPNFRPTAPVVPCANRLVINDHQRGASQRSRLMWHSIRALACRPAVISSRFDGPACRRFRQPLTSMGRSLSRAGAVAADAGERIEEENRPAGERRLRHRSPADHPLWWSATGQDSRPAPAQ